MLISFTSLAIMSLFTWSKSKDSPCATMALFNGVHGSASKLFDNSAGTDMKYVFK